MKVYFAGSITGGRNNHKSIVRAMELVSKYGEVLTEHVGDPNLTAAGETILAREIHDRDVAWLAEADVVVAEVTTPSLGVGYELGLAKVLNKPTLCLFNTTETKHTLSNMIKGPCDDPDSAFILNCYANDNELKISIDNFFKDQITNY